MRSKTQVVKCMKYTDCCLHSQFVQANDIAYEHYCSHSKASNVRAFQREYSYGLLQWNQYSVGQTHDDCGQQSSQTKVSRYTMQLYLMCNRHIMIICMFCANKCDIFVSRIVNLLICVNRILIQYISLKAQRR